MSAKPRFTRRQSSNGGKRSASQAKAAKYLRERELLEAEHGAQVSPNFVRFMDKEANDFRHVYEIGGREYLCDSPTGHPMLFADGFLVEKQAKWL